MYKQTVSKKEIFPYFCRYGSVHNSIVIRLSSQASTCSQLAQKIDSELIAFLSRANSFETNHSFCLITGQFWFAGVFFWGDRNKLKKCLPFGHVSLLRYVVIMNLLRRRNKNQNKTKRKKKKNWRVGVAPADPRTTESASRRTQRPSASIFTVWHGRLPTASYSRGQVTVTVGERGRDMRERERVCGILRGRRHEYSQSDFPGQM